MKFYSRLLFERTCDFNVLLYSGRLFHKYLCEIFVKVDSETLSWLVYNQYKLRASDYIHLCNLLADSANHNNEINQFIGNNHRNNELNDGRLVVLPSAHIGSDRYMRQKMHDIIAISNTLGHPGIFTTINCNPYWPEIQNALFAIQKSDDRPISRHKLVVQHPPMTGDFIQITIEPCSQHSSNYHEEKT